MGWLLGESSDRRAPGAELTRACHADPEDPALRRRRIDASRRLGSRASGWAEGDLLLVGERLLRVVVSEERGALAAEVERLPGPLTGPWVGPTFGLERAPAKALRIPRRLHRELEALRRRLAFKHLVRTGDPAFEWPPVPFAVRLERFRRALARVAREVVEEDAALQSLAASGRTQASSRVRRAVATEDADAP